MKKYEFLKQKLVEIEDIINEMQDTIYMGELIDAVDARIYDTVIGRYLKICMQVEEIKKIVEGVLRCKNDFEKLSFFLQNIYDKSTNQN